MSEVTIIETGRSTVRRRVTVPGANLIQGVDVAPDNSLALVTLIRTKNLVPMTRNVQGWIITNGVGILWPDGRVDQLLLDEAEHGFADPTDVVFSKDGSLAFVTGGLACVFLFILGDSRALNIVPSRIFPLMTNYQLSAIPLFIFMAAMLERAGIINDMFDVIYKVLGGVKGGLASATIIASTILAAMVGVIGAAVVTMGIIALPAMLKRAYDPKIAMGSIMAGGTLGILIPPSVILVIYAILTEQSIGALFAAGLIPGLMLTALFMAVVGLWVRLSPGAAPPAARRPLIERLGALGGIWPVLILFVVVLLVLLRFVGLLWVI